MALLLIEGFEGYAAPDSMVNNGTTNVCRYSTVYSASAMSLTSTTYRTTQPTAANSRSLYIPASVGSDPYVRIDIPNLTEVFVGFGIRFSATNSAAETFTVVGGSSLTASGVTLSYIGTTGQIQVNINGGAVLGTASGTYANSVWYYLEARVKVGSTTGEVQLRINGVDVLNLSSVNTATGSLTSYSTVAIKSGYPYMNVYFDDLYICDSSGSVNNTFIGPLSVYSLMPTSNGSSTQLTPTGAATNWESVDEIAEDTTTYVETNTTGNKDYYNFEDLPAGVTTVHGVRVKALSTTVDNGGRKVKLNMKNGANIISSTLRSLSLGSWIWDTFLSETAPDGSAWTPTSVNATEAGVEAAE